MILLRDILVLLSDLGECLVDWYKIPFSMYYIQSQTLEKTVGQSSVALNNEKPWKCHSCHA